MNEEQISLILKTLPKSAGVYRFYDKDDNIIDASGSDYIINVVKDKQFNKAKVLVKYIESYFEDNGGKC